MENKCSYKIHWYLIQNYTFISKASSSKLNWFKHFKNLVVLVELLRFCILFSQCTRLLHFDINKCYIDRWPKILLHYNDSCLQNCTRWGVVLLSRLDNICIWSVLQHMLRFRLYTYMQNYKMHIQLNGKFYVYWIFFGFSAVKNSQCLPANIASIKNWSARFKYPEI